jgi:hypothetical protein
VYILASNSKTLKVGKMTNGDDQEKMKMKKIKK